MAKLFWLQPDNTIVEFPLSGEQNVIGRGGRSDIRIKHPGISSEHAVIRIQDSVATVEDLKSTNGTRVNGRVVQRHTLRHGDQIVIGREKLMYFAELDSASRFAQPEPDAPYSAPGTLVENVTTGTASVANSAAPSPAAIAAKIAASAAAVTAGSAAAAGANADAPKTTIITRESRDEPALGEQAAAPKFKFAASIHVLSGANAGKRFPLDKDEMTLGREGKQVIVIQRGALDVWSIFLKEGTTPPYINGDAILEPRPLASGDTIELIGVKLRFEMSVMKDGATA